MAQVFCQEDFSIPRTHSTSVPHNTYPVHAKHSQYRLQYCRSTLQLYVAILHSLALHSCTACRQGMAYHKIIRTLLPSCYLCLNVSPGIVSSFLEVKLNKQPVDYTNRRFSSVRSQTGSFGATFTQTDMTDRITLLCIHAQGNYSCNMNLHVTASAVFIVLNV